VSAGVPQDLGERLAAHAPRVQEALAEAVARYRDELPPEVGAAFEHGVLSGGKRLRPILCLEAYHAAGGAAALHDPALLRLAGSIELVHAYSLMHDDLPCMDDADLRRGEPTTHRVHGEAATVRAGVALIPLAALEALEAARALGCDEAQARQVAITLMAASGPGGMVGGQGLDLLGEDRALSEPELTELHRHKTGALLRASLSMGARAAGAGPEVLEAFEAYGDAIGLAFQIADDVLDATASAEVLGKTPSDADRGKSTYVALHGVEQARALARAEVERACAALRAIDLDAPVLERLADHMVSRAY
jgi:geranylgeranyl pyrophosphate synthase